MSILLNETDRHYILTVEYGERRRNIIFEKTSGITLEQIMAIRLDELAAMLLE